LVTAIFRTRRAATRLADRGLGFLLPSPNSFKTVNFTVLRIAGGFAWQFCREGP